MMRKKTTLVLGSNSFTGSHIVDRLLEDPHNHVVGVSRSPEYKDFFLPYKNRTEASLEFHQIDFVQQFDALAHLLEKIRPHVVINVAALSEVSVSHDAPVEYYATNTLAVVRLCDVLRGIAGLNRYVHISSAEIFGTCGHPMNEEARFNPSTPYAVSKAAADMHLNTLIKNFGFPALLIRSTNVYGRHQQLFKIIPRTIIHLKLGEPVMLHGGGNAVKAFLHVRDVVEGLMLALQQGKTGTYHFTSGDPDTIAEVVRKICNGMGHDFDSVTRVTEERRGQDTRYWLDSSKAKRELGWTTRIPFDQGLYEVRGWIENHWAAIRQELLVYQHKGFPLTPAALTLGGPLGN